MDKIEAWGFGFCIGLMVGGFIMAIVLLALKVL